MSIPFLLRGAYTLTRLVADLDEVMDASVKADTWLMPITMLGYVGIADLLPTTAQTSSMLVLFRDRDLVVNNSEAQSLISESDDALLQTTMQKSIPPLDLSRYDPR